MCACERVLHAGQVAVQMNAGWMARFAFKTVLFAAATMYLSESNLGEGLPLWVKHQIYGEGRRDLGHDGLPMLPVSGEAALGEGLVPRI